MQGRYFKFKENICAYPKCVKENRKEQGKTHRKNRDI
jgi:hypothetical protein